MTEFLSAAVLLVALVGAASFSHAVLPYLPEAHRSRDTLDLVRLASSFVITFAALVLGLLTASVNTAFSDNGDAMNALAGSVSRTGACLKAYGPEAEPLRQILRRYAAGVIETTWPEEAKPADYDPAAVQAGSSFENAALGADLQAVELGLVALQPQDDARRKLASLCGEDFAKLLDNRWTVIAHAHGTISTPFYRVLVLMLVLVFACFGISAPRNTLAWVAVGFAAVTIASSVYVVLELDGPLEGAIKVSSASMRSALADFAR